MFFQGKEIKARVLDKRIWPFENFEKAEKVFNRRIKEKTDPNRRGSPRKYKPIETVVMTSTFSVPLP